MRGIVTLAGDGSRMLPWARLVRKEFLPLFAAPSDGRGDPVLKPVAHFVLETLVGAGITDLVLVVRPENLSYVRSYFSIDPAFLRRHAHHPERVRETARFYRSLAHLRIEFRLQRQPKDRRSRGFGDAVLRAAPVVGNEPFVVHAGDAVLLERERGRIVRALADLRARERLDAALLVRPVTDPRRYGVVEGRRLSAFRGMGRLAVTRMVEKPTAPRSRWAATAVYAFGPKIWDALRQEARRHPEELELTDGIARLIRDGGRVQALILTPREGVWRSVGSPERYARALVETRTRAERAPKGRVGRRRRPLPRSRTVRRRPHRGRPSGIGGGGRPTSGRTPRPEVSGARR